MTGNNTEKDEKKELFLKEYIELCRKHELSLQSCGDCDSMWIEPFSINHVFTWGPEYFNCGIEEIEEEEEEIIDES